MLLISSSPSSFKKERLLVCLFGIVYEQVYDQSGGAKKIKFEIFDSKRIVIGSIALCILKL